ncbi:hypothetical protein F953_00111 [Acinetobacter junii CIP 107470 = MTCC 11364]|nr:hypothetical protein F953_00111 [Acinetobacter junii CIP 107470 = MTCC 11364]
MHILKADIFTLEKPDISILELQLKIRIRDFMLNIKQSSPIARNYIFCLNVGSLYFKATPNVV